MIIKYFKIIIIFIFEIIIIDTNAIASIIDDCRNSSFFIQNIKVDITKKNLLEARSVAEKKAKNIALSRLLSRLTLNNSIITPESYNEFDMVEYLKINSEANSNKRYKADFDICFNRESVINFFLKNKLQYAETYRKPISVLPIYRGPRGFILWDPKDLWYSVWNQRLKTLDGLVKLKLAKGSLYLKRNMTTKVILNSDEQIIKKLANNENTDSVLLVVAEPIMLNDGKTYLSTYAKLFDNSGKLKNVLPGNKTPLKTKTSIYNIEERMFQDEVDNILNSIELNWKIDNVIDPNISNRVDLWIPIPISASSTLTEPLISSNKSIKVKSIVGFNKSGIIKINDELIFKNGLKAIVINKFVSGDVLLKFNQHEENFLIEVNDQGVMPLPPYIKRDGPNITDKSNYQTIFASAEGAVAAPTAGLHFTDGLISNLEKKGIVIAPITLHVGAGTFLPVKVENVLDHEMHEEWGSLDQATSDIINKAKLNNKKIIAVGTTSLRILETIAIENNGVIKPWSGFTKLFITPGFKFKIIDILITNFHLPKSTLLMLVSAFFGREELFNIYNHAINKKYRFFSYGDSCLFPKKVDG